jgi:hypothetical protein
MDTLMKLLQYLTLTGTLVGWLGFLVGLGTGILGSWFFKRRENRIFGRGILLVQNELNNVDAEVDKLWSTTFPTQSRVSPDRNKALTVDKDPPLLTHLVNAGKVLNKLAENLRSIANNVEPRSKQKMHAPAPQQESYSYEQPAIPITRQAFRRQQLQENYVDEVESTPAVAYDAPDDDMVQLYNRAVTDMVARERFREHFCPLRIGTVNAVERRQNPTIKAEIRETTDGDFFAVPRGSNEFSVFPRLGLTIEAVSFGAGAIGEVYKTKGHDPKQFYSRYRVKKPAIFELEGELWVLREPGELEFSFGD